MPVPATPCAVLGGTALRETGVGEATGSLTLCLWAEPTPIGVMKAVKNTIEQRTRRWDMLSSPFD